MATYNYNPTPTSGTNAWGMVPGQIQAPDPFANLSAVYPNLGETNSAVSSNILSKLNGQLSPDTVSAIQDAAARFGVTNGISGSGLVWNKSLRDIGTTSEAEQQQGLQDYNSLISTISGTQTLNPALQTQIAETNSTNAAAPNPQQAASYAQQLFDQYLASMRSPAGATYMPSQQQPMGRMSFSSSFPTSFQSSISGTHTNPYSVISTGGNGIGSYMDWSGFGDTGDTGLGSYLPEYFYNEGAF